MRFNRRRYGWATSAILHRLCLALGLVMVGATMLRHDAVFAAERPWETSLGSNTAGANVAGRMNPPYLDIVARQRKGKIRAVDFFESRTDPSLVTAVAVGDLGRIIRSDDGGKTWSPSRSPTSAMLCDVAYIDENRLVAVGNVSQPVTGMRRGVVLSSIDGGRSFEIQSDGQLAGIDQVQRHVRSETKQAVARIRGDWSYHLSANTFESKDAGQSWLPIAETASQPSPGTKDLSTIAIDSIETQLVISASDIRDIPWADAAMASLIWNRCVVVQIVHRSASSIPTSTLTKWRQAAAMIGIYDLEARSPSSNWHQHPRGCQHWIEQTLVKSNPSPSSLVDNSDTQQYLVVDSGGDRETLVPQLGVLRSDFSEDVFRLIAPMQSPVRRFSFNNGKPLLDTFRGQTAASRSASRYQLQLASARLPRRSRVNELFKQAIDRNMSESDAWTSALTALLQRTTDWDRQRLTWMIIREARRIDEAASYNAADHGTMPKPLSVSVLTSLMNLELDPSIGRYASLLLSTMENSREFRQIQNGQLASDLTASLAKDQPSNAAIALSPFENSSPPMDDQNVSPAGYTLAGSGTISIGVPMSERRSQSPSLLSSKRFNDSSEVALWWEFSPAMLLSDSLSRREEFRIDPSDPRLDPLRRQPAGPWQTLLADNSPMAEVAGARPKLDGSFKDWPSHLRPSIAKPLAVMRDDDFMYVAATISGDGGFEISQDSRQQVDLRRDGLSRQNAVWKLSIDVDGDLQFPFELMIAADGSHGDRVADQWQWQPSWYVAHAATAQSNPMQQITTIEIAVGLLDLGGDSLSQVHLSAAAYRNVSEASEIEMPDATKWLTVHLASRPR